MYTRIICFLTLFACYLLLTGCSDENHPNNPVPEIILHEAQDITRTSARLTGTVNVPPHSHTDRYRFRYGTSPDMVKSEEYPQPNGLVTTELQNLTPGTTYYYCLEAGNEKYMRQSPTYNFTTFPNERPRIEPITFLGQGPISIILQCAIIDDGGDPVTACGFHYTSIDGQEMEASAFLTTDNQWRLHISRLKKYTEYTVKAFAENRNGRTYSEPYHFCTSDAVTLVDAGMLPEIIGEDGKSDYTQLSIAGPLNGTDIRFIREMCGKDVRGNRTQGQLQKLDLTDALIVAGGLSYDESRYTTEYTIGNGMFGELDIPTEIKLPENTLVIEQNAFRNCTSLTALSIPGSTMELTPSSGCCHLGHLSVTTGNSEYSSVDGVVYSKDGEVLVWFPEGMKKEELRLSPTLKSIGEYALQKCKIRSIVLPASVTSIGKLAFYASEIESIVLPDGLRSIPLGIFQQCQNLTSVTLGSDCEALSDYCFDGCPLQHLYVNAVIPPVCQPNTFSGTKNIFADCILHIPAESLPIYRNHSTWKLFQHIKVIEATSL